MNADPMMPQLYRVQGLRRETRDTFTMELEPANGSRLSPFQAGQFNMLYLFGVGEAPISISGDPGEPRRLVHTTRVVGTVTRALRKLKRGDALGVRGPFGRGWPVAEAEGKDVVLVAGGIGLAPLRSALYALRARRDRYGKIFLLYGTRTPDDILYPRELQKWRGKFDLDVEITVDRAAVKWKGNVGVVTHLIQRASFDPKKTIAMVCGPEIMMRFTVRELIQRGVGASKIYLSMERNMKCAVGFCGHCLWGPQFVCKNGPVFEYAKIQDWFGRPET